MTTDLAAALATLAEHAPRLRAAGVRSLRIGDIEAEFAPHDPAPPVSQTSERDEDFRDPLEDPATFGTKRAPGFDPPDND